MQEKSWPECPAEKNIKAKKRKLGKLVNWGEEDVEDAVEVVKDKMVAVADWLVKRVARLQRTGYSNQM